MAISATGSISMKTIQAEFGGTDPIKLSEYYRNERDSIPTGYGIPATGPISLNDFRGSQAFILDFVTGLNAVALGTTAGGSATVNIASTAGEFDRYVVIAVGAADASSILVSSTMTQTINGSSGTTVFDNGYITDDDGHRVAMRYRKIGNNDTTVTIGWSAPHYVSTASDGTQSTIYFEPDRGYGIFVYVLCGIPSMGTVNHDKGSGGNTATMTLAGSSKRCAIFVTAPNVADPPTSMTNCVTAATVGGRIVSFYDVNMGPGTITYQTNALTGDAYGAFGGASFPY